MTALPIDFSVSPAQIGPTEYVVTVRGELDMYSAPTLANAVDSLFAAGGKALVLDLREVTFFDSAALGVVTATAKRSRQVGGDTLLACDAPEVMRVLKITGLDRFLTVRRSFGDALAELRTRPA